MKLFDALRYGRIRRFCYKCGSPTIVKLDAKFNIFTGEERVTHIWYYCTQNTSHPLELSIQWHPRKKEDVLKYLRGMEIKT